MNITFSIHKLFSSFIFIVFFSCNHIAATVDFSTDTLILENDKLSVKISIKGAEIVSLYNKQAHFEHIWQGGREWNHHAPILFPIVGKLKNRSYKIAGKTYKMKNHGFASESVFQILEQSSTEILLQLSSKDIRLHQYPFNFKLLVKYSLKNNELYVSHTVINTDDQVIYFSIGGHPGFNIPFSKNENFNDYFIEFCKKETLDRLPLTKEKGLLDTTIITNYLIKSKRLHLNHEMFKNRAIILKDIQSSAITLRSQQSNIAVQLKGINHFPYLGIWSPSKSEAPFVCIEPWYGISDSVESDGDFKSKKAIQKLGVGEKFEMNYCIKIMAL